MKDRRASFLQKATSAGGDQYAKATPMAPRRMPSIAAGGGDGGGGGAEGAAAGASEGLPGPAIMGPATLTLMPHWHDRFVSTRDKYTPPPPAAVGFGPSSPVGSPTSSPPDVAAAGAASPQQGGPYLTPPQHPPAMGSIWDVSMDPPSFSAGVGAGTGSISPVIESPAAPASAASTATAASARSPSRNQSLAAGSGGSAQQLLLRSGGSGAWTGIGRQSSHPSREESQQQGGSGGVGAQAPLPPQQPQLGLSGFHTQPPGSSGPPSGGGGAAGQRLGSGRLRSESEQGTSERAAAPQQSQPSQQSGRHGRESIVLAHPGWEEDFRSRKDLYSGSGTDGEGHERSGVRSKQQQQQLLLGSGSEAGGGAGVGAVGHRHGRESIISANPHWDESFSKRKDLYASSGGDLREGGGAWAAGTSDSERGQAVLHGEGTVGSASDNAGPAGHIPHAQTHNHHGRESIVRVHPGWEEDFRRVRSGASSNAGATSGAEETQQQQQHHHGRESIVSANPHWEESFKHRKETIAVSGGEGSDRDGAGGVGGTGRRHPPTRLHHPGDGPASTGSTGAAGGTGAVVGVPVSVSGNLRESSGNFREVSDEARSSASSVKDRVRLFGSLPQAQPAGDARGGEHPLSQDALDPFNVRLCPRP